MMAMLAIGAWAEESVYKTLTFSAETNSAAIGSYTASWSATVDGFTWNLQNFNNNNNGWNYVKCGRKNVESVGTISTASAIDEAVTKVVVTVDAVTVSNINSTTLTVASDANFTSDVQTIEVAAAKGQMTYTVENPSENCYYKLTYDCASGSSNGLITISKVEYYIDGETPVVTVAAPTFSPAAGEVEAGTAVTISAPDAEMIVYTTDGTAPSYANNNGEIYTEPIVVNEAMTIKAIAVDADENESAVATAAYTIKPEAVSVATVAEFNALADNTAFTFTGSLVVSAQTGNYLYAQDATGGMLLFKATTTYSMNQVIPAGWTGTKTTYNGAPEATNMAGLSAATTTSELTAQELTPDQVTQQNPFLYAVIKGASISDGNIVVGEESVAIYNRFSVTAPTDNNTYDVYGITGYYNGTQFMPLEYVANEVEVATPVITGETPFIGSTTVTITCEEEGVSIHYTLDGTDPSINSPEYTAPFELTETTTVKAIAFNEAEDCSVIVSKEFVKTLTVATVAEYNALAENTEFVFTGNLVVSGQKGKNLYAQDATGGVLLYGNAPAFTKGDVIPTGFSATKTNYNGTIEMTNFTLTAATETADIVAEEVVPAQWTEDNINIYAVIKGATIDGSNLVVGENSVVTYNRFGVTAPTDTEKAYDVYGVTSWYSGAAQFYPLEYVEVVEPVVENTITFVAEQEGGTIAVALEDGTAVESGVTKVAAGAKVTVTATPAEGYKLSELVVKCGETVVELDADETTGRAAAETHTFTMPEGEVNIEATFEEDTQTGIDNINMENVKNVRYYNVAGVESATPFQGVNIVVRVMNDGSKSVTKMVK